jgi:GGDEF domain-containing protein/tetratricopeptide (TPR) repeat protein
MPDVARRLEKAEKLLQKRKLDEALDELLHALHDDPRNDEIRGRAADLCATLGHANEAAQLYSDSFQQHAAAGDAARAAAAYKKLAHVAVPAVEQTLRYAELMENGNRAEACVALKAAVGELVRNGFVQQALAAQRKLAALEPAMENVAYQGELAVSCGEYAAAAADFLRVAPQVVPQQGFEYLRRAYELDPQNTRAVLEFTKVLLEREDFESAANVLAPHAFTPQFQPLYARALLSCGRLQEAEPVVFAAYESDPTALEMISELIGRWMDAGEDEAALRLLHRVEVRETQRKKRREFILLVKEQVMRRQPRIELLRYLSELLNSANREHDYCEVLGRLFDLYYASGKFTRAGDALDRAGEVDPYDPANQRRLDMLRGKLDPRRFQAVAARFGKVEESTEPAADEPTVLEDLMLQAEIFLRYNMQTRAQERLQRINKLFPDEEQNNAKLHDLYERSAFTPQSAGGSAEPARSTAAPATSAPAVAVSEARDPLARVADLARNLQRHTQINNLLFGAANDIGRALGATRCVTALCMAGKPPASFAEYCAPGTPKSSVDTLVKAIAAGSKGAAEMQMARNEGTKSPLAPVAALLDCKTLLACSLLYRDEFTGVLLIGGGGKKFAPENDVVIAVADQLAAAAANIRLRQLVDALAAHDESSGLLKRTSWSDALMFEVARSMEQRSPLTLALMQIGSNAALRSLGESAGRALMLEVAQLVTSHIRNGDLAVRYDRGIIGLALAAADENAATLAVLKLRRLLEAAKLKPQPLNVTCGIAQCLLDPQFEPADVVTEAANRVQSALESAWADGGNTSRALPMPTAVAEPAWL